MKTFNIAAILSSLALLAAGAAYAEDSVKQNAHSHQFMSKRPYHQTVANKTNAQDAQWEGATYIADESRKDDSQLKNQNAVRMNHLAKRPF
jgi:hypothetical protein